MRRIGKYRAITLQRPFQGEVTTTSGGYVMTYLSAAVIMTENRTDSTLAFFPDLDTAWWAAACFATADREESGDK